jgi:hypothetical protein
MEVVRMDVLDWAGHPVSKWNAAWHLWNMSNRVSNVQFYARSCQKLVESPVRTAGWPEPTSRRLNDIAGRLQALAADADALCARLREASDRYDPGLVEPAGDIYVLHCRDDNPALTDALHIIWRESSHCVHEAQELKGEVDRLLSDRGGAPQPS